VARVGGEEFVLLLPDINEASAFVLAEKLRKRVQSELIYNINITVSIGLVVSGKTSKIDFGVLLGLSDKALYESKRTGRNKTTVVREAITVKQ
jgi:sigma-B regulation protein RsbQ